MTPRQRNPQTPGRRAKKAFTEAEIEAARKAYEEKATIEHVRKAMKMGYDRTYELLAIISGVRG
jgi:hypothetical protein